MTELERRALLGDRQAQEECTRRGIALPCPLCGRKADKVVYDAAGMFICKRCKIYKPFTLVIDGARKALAVWNTRPAPPIGRCKDCANKENATVNAKGFLVCPASGMEITDTDFCSYYEPKTPLKELATLQPLDGVGSKEIGKKNYVQGYPPKKVYCADCKNPNNPKKCLLAGQEKPISTFCSGFEPKGGEENG